MIKVMEVEKNYLLRDYLESDGMPLLKRYNQYLKKCKDFKKKANNYKYENASVRKSVLPKNKLGYEASEVLEEDILRQRKYQLDTFKRMYDATLFFEDRLQMFECFEGKSKLIRIIRELKPQEEKKELSENFGVGNECWFTRYCMLSKFIQAARSVIIRNRMIKNLNLLKLLTRKKIAKLLKNEYLEIHSILNRPEEDSSDSSENTLVKNDSRIKAISCLTLPCGKCSNKKKNVETISVMASEN